MDAIAQLNTQLENMADTMKRMQTDLVDILGEMNHVFTSLEARIAVV